MTRRKRDKLPPPTQEERAAAARSAQAMLAAIEDPALRGKAQTMHVDLSRPRRGEWWTTWTGLPGLVRINGQFCHVLLPGWRYSRAEVRLELIPDLIRLAEHGERPTDATS